MVHHPSTFIQNALPSNETIDSQEKYVWKMFFEKLSIVSYEWFSNKLDEPKIMHVQFDQPALCPRRVSTLKNVLVSLM